LKSALNATAGQSLLADRLKFGIDWNLLVELFQSNLGLGPSIAGLAMVTLGLYFFAALFFAGGAFEVLRKSEDRTGFWSGCARHFWTFVRILIWTVPFVILVGLIVIFAEILKRWIVGDDPLQNVAFWSRVTIIVIAFLGILFLSLIADYARAYSVLEGDRRAAKSVWRAFRFILRHPIRTGGFLFLILLVSGLSAVVFRWFGSASGIFNSGPASVLFVLGQVYLLVKIVFRLTRYGGVLDIVERAEFSPLPGRQIPEQIDEEEPLVTLETT
jgi:hypothetical protein